MPLSDDLKHQNKEGTNRETIEQIRLVLHQGWESMGHPMREDTVHPKLISDHLSMSDATNHHLVSQTLPYQLDRIANQASMRPLRELQIEPLRIAKVCLGEGNHHEQNLLEDPTRLIKDNPSMRRGKPRCMHMSKERGKKKKEKQYYRER
jgi:hypothetical protein